MLEGLAAIHPAFAKWNKKARSRAKANIPYCAMPPRIDELTQIFERGRFMTDVRPRRPMLDLGFFTYTWNGQEDPSAASFSIQAGSFSDHPYPNHIVIHLPRPPSSLIEPATLRLLLLNVAAAWCPDSANIATSRYFKLLGDPNTKELPPVRSGWLTYLSPAYARLVTPPPQVTSEPAPDGGLLMIATPYLFDTDNPAHVEAALAVQAALAPVNALPRFVEFDEKWRRIRAQRRPASGRQ
jgi:hypothetical protein